MKTSEVIKYFKTQSKTGAALGCNQSTVSLWGEYPPDARQLQIERLTNHLLKAELGCLDRVMGMDKVAEVLTPVVANVAANVAGTTSSAYESRAAYMLDVDAGLVKDERKANRRSAA